MAACQRIGTQPTSGPSNTTLGHIPKDICSIILQRQLFKYVMAALFVIARTCKLPRCPTTEEKIKKMWYIYKMEYHSFVKK